MGTFATAPAVMPVTARVHFDDHTSTFHAHLRILVADADGRKYETEVVEEVNLGDLLTLIAQYFTFGTFGIGSSPENAMEKPNDVTMPLLNDANYGKLFTSFETADVDATLGEDHDDSHDVADPPSWE